MAAMPVIINASRKKTIESFCYVCYKVYMESSHTISTTLRTIRANLDLTQEQLAERLGVSFATVNRWEGGFGHAPEGGSRSHRRAGC